MSMDLNGQIQNLFTRDYTASQKKKLEDAHLIDKDNKPAIDFTFVDDADKYSLLKEFDEWMTIDNVMESNNLSAAGKARLAKSDSKEFAEFQNVLSNAGAKAQASLNTAKQTYDVDYFSTALTTGGKGVENFTPAEKAIYDSLTDDQKNAIDKKMYNYAQSMAAASAGASASAVANAASAEAQKKAAAAGTAQGNASGAAANSASFAASVNGLKDDIAGNEVAYFTDKLKSGKNLTNVEQEAYKGLTSEQKAEITTNTNIANPIIIETKKPEMITETVNKGLIGGVSPDEGDKYTTQLEAYAKQIMAITPGSDISNELKDFSNLDEVARKELQAYMKSSGIATSTVDEMQKQLTLTPNPIETADETANNMIAWINSPGEYASTYFKDNFKASLEHLNLTYADKQEILAAFTSKLQEQGKDIKNFSKISSVLNSAILPSQQSPTIAGSIDGVEPGGNNAYQAKLKSYADAIAKLSPGDSIVSLLGNMSSFDSTSISNLKTYVSNQKIDVNISQISDELTPKTSSSDIKRTAQDIITTAKNPDATVLSNLLDNVSVKGLNYADKQALLKELNAQGFDIDKNDIVKNAIQKAPVRLSATDSQIDSIVATINKLQQASQSNSSDTFGNIGLYGDSGFNIGLGSFVGNNWADSYVSSFSSADHTAEIAAILDKLTPEDKAKVQAKINKSSNSTSIALGPLLNLASPISVISPVTTVMSGGGGGLFSNVASSVASLFSW